MHDIKLATEKNAPILLTISMAMRIRRYGSKHITQYGRSRATLDATRDHHRASIHPVLPWRLPWSLIFDVVKSLFEASAQKARNGPSTHVIEATSCIKVKHRNKQEYP